MWMTPFCTEQRNEQRNAHGRAMQSNWHINFADGCELFCHRDFDPSAWHLHFQKVWLLSWVKLAQLTRPFFALITIRAQIVFISMWLDQTNLSVMCVKSCSALRDAMFGNLKLSLSLRRTTAPFQQFISHKMHCMWHFTLSLGTDLQLQDKFESSSDLEIHLASHDELNHTIV